VKTLVNMLSPDYQQSPLHFAVMAGNYRMAELLIAQGADLDAKDKSENSPLHYAFQKGFLAVGELLIERGASISCANTRGTTPFHYLVGQRWEEEGSGTSKAIVAAGSQTSELALKGSDATVQKAQDHMHLPLFRYLLDLMLKMGQDINVSDKSQETPLHRAVLAGNARPRADTCWSAAPCPTRAPPAARLPSIMRGGVTTSTSCCCCSSTRQTRWRLDPTASPST